MIYKIGDKVKILVGHSMWKNTNGRTETIDIREDLIGCIGTLEYKNDNYNNPNKWCIDIEGHGKISWFNENQFKLVENKVLKGLER